jgi:hypothetical protein
VTVVIEFQQQFLYVSQSESETRAMVIFETKAKPELEVDREGWGMRKETWRGSWEIVGEDEVWR